MAEEYEVVQFRKSDYRDTNGNYWCDMALKGVSEPVKIVVKDPMQFHDGMMLYGTITDETGKTSGRPYLRFRREKREEQPAATSSSTSNWQPRDDMAIRAQWAIKTAVQLQTAFATLKNDPALLRSSEVEDAAKYFYGMIDRVKNSTTPLATVSAQSGYDAFKQSRPQPKDEEDFQSMMEKGLEADGIDINDIPF